VHNPLSSGVPNSARGKVLVVGSIGIDCVKTPLGEANDVLGGAATYASVSASFFAPVLLVGVVGDDFPSAYLDLLASHGIDLQGLQRANGETFRWSGFYDYDLNQAHSLDTRLGVFASFHPTLPASYLDAEYVLLANIDPELQLEVLEQVRKPRLVACDTMNFWISGKRDALVDVLGKVDLAFMNDAEARQLTGTMSIVKAAREILRMGPSYVVIKKGEHGATLFSATDTFSVPAYPLEEVPDPTGAGDSFEGGVLGFIAYSGDISEHGLRKGVVYGSVMASFNVEEFSLRRMLRLSHSEIAARYREFKRLAFFEALEDAGDLEAL